MDAEIKCVGTGRIPRVEMDRDVDTGEIEESCVSEKVLLSGELRIFEDRDQQGRGRSRDRRMHLVLLYGR